MGWDMNTGQVVAQLFVLPNFRANAFRATGEYD